MKQDGKRIRALTDKFFDGRTSNAEEKELNDYFHGNDVADELREYVDYFDYLNGGLIDELRAAPVPQVAQIIPPRRLNTQTLWIGSCAAAAIAMVCMLAFGHIADSDSRMVVNGKRVRNAEIIELEQRKIWSLVKERDLQYGTITAQSQQRTQEITDIILKTVE